MEHHRKLQEAGFASESRGLKLIVSVHKWLDLQEFRQEAKARLQASAAATLFDRSSPTLFGTSRWPPSSSKRFKRSRSRIDPQLLGSGLLGFLA